MTRTISIFAAWAVLGLTLAASAQVPGQVSFTARLSDASGPVTGPVDVTFALFAAPAGGEPVWSETQTGVMAEDGLMHASIGAAEPLTAEILNGSPLFLGVTINGDALSPRVGLTSVPYAVRAGVASVAETANSADTVGDIPADALVTEVTAGDGLAVARSGGEITISADDSLQRNLASACVWVEAPVNATNTCVIPASSGETASCSIQCPNDPATGARMHAVGGGCLTSYRGQVVTALGWSAPSAERDGWRCGWRRLSTGDTFWGQPSAFCCPR